MSEIDTIYSTETGKSFNPNQNGLWGSGKKGPPTSFSLKISTKIGIISQNFLTLIFNPFATLPQNTKAIPSATPKLLNLNQDHSPQKVVFWSNPYKIEVMITSLIEILDHP